MIRAQFLSAEAPGQARLCSQPGHEDATQDIPSFNALSGEELSKDRLAYLADMVHELAGLARDGKWHTLAGLLALAHIEACQQSKRTSGQDVSGL